MAEVPQRQAVNQTALRWHPRATGDKPRTASAVDADVSVTLPRQWVLLQPYTRLNAEGQISAAANSSMDWSDVLAPGIDGVRALVVTMLQWAYNIQGNEEEEWRRLAVDISQVFRILTSQSASMCGSTTDRDAYEPPFPVPTAIEPLKKPRRVMCVTLHASIDEETNSFYQHSKRKASGRVRKYSRSR